MLKAIDREKGLPSQTEVWVVARYKRFSLVRSRLHTGRGHHRIRVHMQAMGHPLVCDHHYGLRDESCVRAISPSRRQPHQSVFTLWLQRR